MSTLLFDLDGTLVDSAPTITLRLNAALNACGYADVNVDAVRPLLGNAAPELVAAAIQAQGAHEPADVCAGIANDFLSRYRDAPVEGSVLYPDCLAILGALRDRGHRLAICTNKPEITALPVLKEMGLMPYFEIVLCGDRAEAKKPDRRHITQILDAMGARPDDAVMVGDSVLDIEAAHNASVTSVHAVYGYDPVGGANALPHHSIEKLTDLFPVLDGR